MPIPAAFDLSGRVAVVTGAGGPDGIGFATAKAGMVGLTRAAAVDTARPESPSMPSPQAG